MNKLLLILLCFTGVAMADPNGLDAFIQELIILDKTQPTVVKVPQPLDFSLVGIDCNDLVDVRDMRVRVLMLTEGELYLLGNQDRGFSKATAPKKERTVRKRKPFSVVYNPQPIWSHLEEGVNEITASETNDPNSYWFNIFDPNEGFSSWQLTAIDYAGTGRTVGVGIEGDVYSIQIDIVELNAVKHYKLIFDIADINRDGKVDLADQARLSAAWLKELEVIH